jgi:protein SCO1
MRRWLALVLAALALSPVALAGLVGVSQQDHLRSGVFDPPRTAPDFSLAGSDGSPLTLQRYRGKVVLLEFGFTHCPAICPTTLGNLVQMFRKLGPAAKDVQLVFVTVDPKRDSVERLHEYLGQFNPAFIGGTEPPGLGAGTSRLEAVRRAYGVVVAEQARKTEAGYDVHHSSSIYLIDRRGALRALVPFGKASDDILHDVKVLLNE